MPQVPKRLSYSFVIGLALFVVCLIYLPHWRQYAPSVHPVPTSPYLTPWTVASVTTLSLGSCSHRSSGTRTESYSNHPLQDSRDGCLLFCCRVLLEYACGIRVPDLDVFFLPDSSGHRAMLYAARPTAQSATTSLLFASALLIFHRGFDLAEEGIPSRRSGRARVASPCKFWLSP